MSVIFGLAGVCVGLAGATFAASLPLIVAGTWLIVAAYANHVA